MRVLIVSANQERSPDPVAPLGACYVATATAAAGHDVAVLDLCFSQDVDGDVRDAVAAHRPEVIGLAMRNVDNCAFPDTMSYTPHYARVVAAARATSDAPIVLGGSAFTTMPRFYLPALAAPYGIVGEGEVAFPMLLERLARGVAADDVPGVARWNAADGTVVVNPPAWLPDVDAVRADRRWMDVGAYYREGGMANLQTKRGCHYKCTFCAYPVIEGRGMRTRDLAGIAAEVRELLDVHGVTQFFIVDSVFNAPRGYAERVCEALRPLGRHIRWSCFVTPGNFTAELLDAMLAAGCQSIDFGTDAGSNTTLRAFRKSFDVDDIRAASRLCRERGVPFCHSLVFGGERETWDTVAETIALMDACRPTAVTAMCGVRVYPETPLAATLLARGEVPSPEALHKPWFYFAPAVRDGLADVVAHAARERGNWLLPGMKMPDEEALHARLRGRGLKGDLWRFVSRLRLGHSLAGAAGDAD
ncbi:MAG TPA: radical SAM protein [Candidatus Limnocylindria bacterium]|nr:radical SAM protein [Candidatus Limnocylindria bacterium]